MSQKSVSVSKLAKLLDLKVFTKELDIKKHKVTLSDVNRPALQLSGYFEYFEPNRVDHRNGRIQFLKADGPGQTDRNL